MGKYFPKLTQSVVFIETDENGQGFSCPMLPVSALNEIEKFGEKLAKAAKDNDLKTIGNVRKEMIELAKTVIPAEYHENLFRLDVPRCTELLTYLMYGDPENNDKAPNSEKN